MDWKKMADKAKQIVDQRGGPKSVEEDAQELRDIAGGEGSMTDKLKRAAQAIKEPGAPGHGGTAGGASAGTPSAGTPAPGTPEAPVGPPAGPGTEPPAPGGTPGSAV